VRDSSWSLIGFTGERLEAVAALPGFSSWGWNQSVLVDGAGDWWIGSGDGVFRYSGLASPSQISRASPTAVYTTADGLATDVVVRLFGDSRGDVWVGTASGINGLSRWRRATASFEHFTDAEGLPPLDTYYVSAFAEDRTGAVWIGFSGDGGLARWRDGVFTRFAMDAGLPPGAIRNLIVDSRGRLWAASYYGGLVRCDEPQAESPEFTIHTTSEGLSSNSVTALVEGPHGGIYIATGRGIDRLDPLTGRITRISRGTYSQGEIGAAVSDRQGVLWFNAQYGLLRLQPRDAPLSASPETVLTGVRIAGNEVPVSALGQTVLDAMTLSPAQDGMEIDFVAPGWEPERAIRYQVQLDGADTGWGELSTRRSIRYASLSPGHYEFRVRAVSGEGDTGETARFAFRILPPVWRRWWFLVAAMLTATAVAIGLHRYRVDRLLEVANLRTRIATDLHDDIGANLTRISVISEVARRQSGENEVRTDRRLASIAELARDSIGSLADIVWAVHPELDRMEDLTRKLREYAEDLVQSHSIELDFTVPDLDGAHRIEIDARRDLFLIFKEAIRNSVLHSGCARISVDLRTSGSGLELKVTDDGLGFDPEAAVDGNGLVNMRRRADRIGARLRVESRSGDGTTVRLIRPVSRTSRRG
jgi:signal transduction histidine kinase/streptogramin lyase